MTEHRAVVSEKFRQTLNEAVRAKLEETKPPDPPGPRLYFDSLIVSSPLRGTVRVEFRRAAQDVASIDLPADLARGECAIVHDVSGSLGVTVEL